jgi:hypothetical protein
LSFELTNPKLGIFIFLDSISKDVFMEILKKITRDAFLCNFLLKNLKPSITKLLKEPMFPTFNLEINVVFNITKD